MDTIELINLIESLRIDSILGENDLDQDDLAQILIILGVKEYE